LSVGTTTAIQSGIRIRVAAASVRNGVENVPEREREGGKWMWYEKSLTESREKLGGLSHEEERVRLPLRAAIFIDTRNAAVSLL